MATLTQEQTDFLKSHHIPMDKTFDASGLSSKAYKAKMKENGTLVAYGTPSCPKGHTLRNKQANCLQCNPQAVSSIKRQATAGDVYIAISPSHLITKISTTTDPYAPDQYGARQLAYRMNQDKHGEISDWEVLYIGKTPSVGEFENQLQQHLASQQISKKLTATSKTTKASQIYDIDIHDVLDLLKTWKIAAAFHDDNKIAQFHDSYHQQATQRQQEQQRLAEAQAERLQAEENAKILAKQQEQQRLQAEQEKAKQAKLEQKRQKQVQLDQQRQEKLTKQKTKPQAKTQNFANSDTPTPPQTGILSKPHNTGKPAGQAIWQKLTQTQWLMLAVGVFLLLSVIIFAVLR